MEENKEKIAEIKKAKYEEKVEKSRIDSAARSRKSYLKNPEKSHADSAGQSQESYQKDLKP